MKKNDINKEEFIEIKDNLFFHQSIQNIDPVSQKKKQELFESILDERCKIFILKEKLG